MNEKLQEFFEERDGVLTIRKDVNLGDHQEVPHRSPLDPPQVGTADGEARRRRLLGQTRAEQCAPRLLQGQEQTSPAPRRPRSLPRGNLARKNLRV